MLPKIDEKRHFLKKRNVVGNDESADERNFSIFVAGIQKEKNEW